MEFAGVCGGEEFSAAAFVVKTYQMVSDPANNAIISWGPNSNSFVVFDPFALSQTLLPAHFKHSNFSSFVRQLNTYGFRKVDPDRWEFAHVSFLRGETKLLRHIVRKRKAKSESYYTECENDALVMQVVKLNQEQSAIEDKLESLWRRVRETERRPRQMLGFLMKVFEDPQILDRVNRDRAGFGSERNVSFRMDPPPGGGGGFSDADPFAVGNGF